jgi:tetratricopeptide (TPR) repeat protein
MACLDDALAGLRAFVDFWAAPPANVDVTAAGRGSRALADPAACETAVPQPEMPPRTPAEEALFTELAAANVARSAAAFDRTIEIAHGVAEKARAIGSDRVFARARVISGEALGFEQKMDDAERELREAAEAAARGKDDLLAANAWGALIVQIGVHEGKPAEALSLATAARAAVSRTGDDRDAAIRLHLDLARVMVTAGDYAGARAELEPAVAMVDAPPRQPDKLVGEIHSQLAMTLMELGDPVDRDAWVKHLERALEAQRRAYGDSHPAVAQTLQYIAVDKSRNGDPAGALVELERSLAAFAASLGEDQPVYAGALGDKAVALVRLGELDAALPVAERGAEIMTAALGAEHPNTISAWALVGSVLRVKGDAAGAIAVLEKAFAAADPAAPPLELLELARAYADAGRMKDARATIDRARAAGLDVTGALEEPAAVDER